MGDFMETSLGAPVKWASSLSMYVKPLVGRLNTVVVILFCCFLLQKLSNYVVYVNQVIIWELLEWLVLTWGIVMFVQTVLIK